MTQSENILTKLGLSDGRVSDPGQTILGARVPARVVQDFRPICESLEWQLSETYWRTAGLRGFLGNEVPYLVNNSGTLSAHSAELLFENCVENPPRGPLRIMELGAGTGLFARYLLDAFRRLCRERGADFYDRLTFIVSDGSQKTVDQWREYGIFLEHQEHVLLGRCDATNPSNFECRYSGETFETPLRAVFANYLLDSLPASVVRKGPDGPEEQYVRTHLADEATVAQYTRLTVDEIRAIASSTVRERWAELIPLVNVLEFETEFRPVNGRLPGLDHAIAFGCHEDRFVLNYGAFRCLEHTLQLLDHHGFMLINDYAALPASEQAPTPAGLERFGPTCAIGMNFPLLRRYVASLGVVVVEPRADERVTLHPRMLVRTELPQTHAAFMRVFDEGAQAALLESDEEARRHIEAGRMEQAKEAFARNLSNRRFDWRLVGELAEFTIRQLRDFKAGLDLAHAALTINPWYSVWLWNLLGDALFGLDRVAEAHEAYLHARRIEPKDARTCFSLSYTYTHLGDYQNALIVIAEGLAYDASGTYRQGLLEKQQQVLTLASQRWNNEQEWHARRIQRLSQ